MEKKEKKKVNKKILIITIIIIISICLLFSVIFAIINISNNKIIKGITIQNIDVSKYTKEEALEKFEMLIQEEKSKKIILKYEQNETEITPEDLEATYNVKEVIEEAYLIGRSDNIFVNNFNIVQSFIFGKNLEIELTINENKLSEIINSFSETLPGKVEQYSYYIEDEELVVTKGKDGIAVKKEELVEEIKEILKDFSSSSSIIDAPVEFTKAEEIDIDKIHSEVYKEPQDAYITEDPITVHPHVNGIDFDISIEEAKELIKEDKEEYIIPLKITIANKTLKDLGQEAFPNQLSTFSTKYDSSNENRTTNIKLASEKINNTIIMPGETFSYNQTVGKRTIEAGYKEAGAYAGGQVVQTVGGGICQVSSTLYNAVLYANLEIVERYNHYFESSYVDAGRDATVSWGTLDFKFKNNRKYPIKIVSTSKNGVETVSIYGIKEETEYEVIIQSKVISSIKRSVRYEDDAELEIGKEIISQNGHDGCISETYKIVRLNGEIVSNTLLSRDTYHSLERIIRRGTKEIEDDETEETSGEVITDVSDDITENKQVVNEEVVNN